MPRNSHQRLPVLCTRGRFCATLCNLERWGICLSPPSFYLITMSPSFPTGLKHMMYDILGRKYFVERYDSARRPTQHSLYPVVTLAGNTPPQVTLSPCGGKMRTLVYCHRLWMLVYQKIFSIDVIVILSCLVERIKTTAMEKEAIEKLGKVKALFENKTNKK